MQIETAPAESEGWPRSAIRKHKKCALASLILYAAILGGVGAFLPDEPQSSRMTDLLFCLPLPFLGSVWCSLDALERGRRMSTVMRVFLLLLFGVAFPVYLFRSRGLGGFKTLMFTALFGVVCCVVAFLSLLLGLCVGDFFGVAA